MWNTQNHVDLVQTHEEDPTRVVNQVVKDHTLAEDPAVNVLIRVVSVHIRAVDLLPTADHIRAEDHILGEGLTGTDPTLTEGITENAIIVIKSVILADTVKKRGKRTPSASVISVDNLDIR